MKILLTFAYLLFGATLFTSPLFAQDSESGVVIAPLATQQVLVGQSLSVRVVPEDSDGTVPSLFARMLPVGASLDDNGDGTRTFNWTPGTDNTGTHVIEMVAVSASRPDDSFVTALTIEVSSGEGVATGSGSDDFFIEPLSDQFVTVENAMVIKVTPRRSDGLVANLRVEPMLENASFDDNGDGTRTLVYRPESGEEGERTFTFIATDPNDSDSSVSESITVTVMGTVDDPDSGAPDNSDPDGGDPDSGGPDNSSVLAFAENLEGIRSYGCVPGGEGDFTFEFVEVYSNGLLFDDFWLYEEPECVTRPLTFSSVLGVQSYILGDPVLTDDGREAVEIVFETLQVSSEAGEDAFPVGTILFDIVALEQGGVTLGTTLATTPEDRPSTLLPAATATPIGVRADAASSAGLQGQWLAECFNGRIQQREFGETEFVETVQSFAEDTCEILLGTRINTWSITYLEPVLTVFGQPALRTSTELIDSRVENILIDSSLPPPPTTTELGLVFEDIWGVIDNELVIGTCLDKGPADCGVGDNIPDLLNYNVGNRFVRQ